MRMMIRAIVKLDRVTMRMKTMLMRMMMILLDRAMLKARKGEQELKEQVSQMNFP